MKNNLHLITIHCIIAASSSIAMESELLDLKKYNLFKKPKILSEITSIKEPLQAEYLAEDRILVNGYDGCSIINPATKKEIKKIDVQAPYFAIHPTTKKIAFGGKNPAIYSSSGELETLINSSSITKPVFDPLHNNILLEEVNGYSTSYDCATGHKARMGAGKISLIAFHPTQKISYMCHPIGGWFSNPCIEIYSTTTSQQTNRIGLGYHCNPTHILCSPNGSLIAVQNGNKAVYIIERTTQKQHFGFQKIIKLPTIKSTQFIMNPVTDTLTAIQYSADDTWVDILFHPNSAVLATVMQLYIDHESHQIVFYWDVITQQLITTMPPLPSCSRHIHKNIAFSPDGKILMVVLPDKCITLPVPSEVLYDTTEKLPYLYWFLLKEYSNQHDVPDDVQNIIALALLEAKFKR